MTSITVTYEDGSTVTFEPAPANVTAAIQARFGESRPVVIDPDKPNTFRYDPRNTWDGYTEVHAREDGTYDFINCYGPGAGLPGLREEVFGQDGHTITYDGQPYDPPEPYVPDEPVPLCPGHPAGPSDPMGETFYCDGSCQTAEEDPGEGVYILTTQNPDGSILDQELFSSKPTFALEPGMTLRVGNINGGDSAVVSAVRRF